MEKTKITLKFKTIKLLGEEYVIASDILKTLKKAGYYQYGMEHSGSIVTHKLKHFKDSEEPIVAWVKCPDKKYNDYVHSLPLFTYLHTKKYQSHVLSGGNGRINLYPLRSVRFVCERFIRGCVIPFELTLKTKVDVKINSKDYNIVYSHKV